MQRAECEIKLIPAPEGWGVYCKTHSFRKGPFQQKPKAEAAADEHRNSVKRGP